MFLCLSLVTNSMDTDELILQQAMLLRAQLCRAAAAMNNLAAIPSGDTKLSMAESMVRAAEDFSGRLEYILAEGQ